MRVIIFFVINFMLLLSFLFLRQTFCAILITDILLFTFPVLFSKIHRAHILYINRIELITCELLIDRSCVRRHL